VTGLFEAWMPEERWLSGLLWADGHVDARWKIQLNLTDEDALSAAAKIAGRPYHTYQQPPQTNGKPQLPLHRLTFDPGPAAVRQMITLGFGPKPARLWPGPPLASGAFLRGLFDGDGCAGWRRVAGNYYLQSRFRGPYAVLDGAQQWLTGQGFSPRRVYLDGDGYTVQWSHRDSLRLAEVMYGEPGPFIARKRDVLYGEPS
jgi:hypothetical protein